MSHFAVLVIGANIDEILAPFQENNMGDCPAKYLVFDDQEAEYLARYNTESQTRVVMPDGSLVSPTDDQFKIPGTTFMDNERYRVPAELVQREVPYTELFATFEEFMSEYCGYSERDPEKGRYGFWENPNAKWDWFQLGGRWTGFFKLKPDAQGIVGEQGLMTPAPRAGLVDQARKGDIDFVAMRIVAANKASAVFDRYEAIIAEHGEPPLLDQEDKEKKAAYLDHPAVTALYAEHLLGFGSTVSEQFGMGREKYIALAEAASTGTFAIVHEGKWYERGEMGWFGCVSDGKNPDDWYTEHRALLDSLPDDAILSLVDCHI